MQILWTIFVMVLFIAETLILVVIFTFPIWLFFMALEDFANHKKCVE